MVSDLVARLKDAELEIRDLSLYVAHLHRQKEAAEQARKGTESACSLLEEELTALSACVGDLEEEHAAERLKFHEKTQVEAARRQQEDRRKLEEKMVQDAVSASKLSVIREEAGMVDRELRSGMHAKREPYIRAL